MTTTTKIYSFNPKTDGVFVKVETLISDTLVDDELYDVQVLGGAYLMYSATTPTDGLWIENSDPFTYEKKSGEDLYVMTNRKFKSSTVKIVGQFTVGE